MARTSLCSETCDAAAIPKNRGGAHGGIDPNGGKSAPDAPAEGSSGNPGTQLPWDGADATDIGSTTPLPPLTHL